MGQDSSLAGTSGQLPQPLAAVRESFQEGEPEHSSPPYLGKVSPCWQPFKGSKVVLASLLPKAGGSYTLTGCDWFREGGRRAKGWGK